MTIFMIIVAVLITLGFGVLLQLAQMFFPRIQEADKNAPTKKKRGTGNHKAVVACAGPGATVRIFQYVGLSDCRLIHSLYSGDRNCKDTCLGYGTCRDICPLGAIVMDNNGLPRVLDECDGCGLCVAECPSGAIQLVPRDADFVVRCISRAAPENRTSFCAHACTACDACRKAGEGMGFSIRDGLAHINYRVKSDRKAAAKVCPTGCIVANKNAFQGTDNRLEWTDRDSGASDASK